MPRENLRKSIKKLRAEVDRIDVQEKDVKNQMETLLGELEEEAKKPEDSERSQKLADKLKEMIAEYEVKHPGIATALEEILWTLSNMGI